MKSFLSRLIILKVPKHCFLNNLWCWYDPSVQIRVAPQSRNSAWVAFDGRNRQEIKQGDRWVCVAMDTVHTWLGRDWFS